MKATKKMSKPKNLMHHGEAVLKNVETTIATWDEKNYEKAGEMFGQILKLTQQTGASHVQQFAEFLLGVSKQFGGHFNLTALLICINEEDQAVMLFYQAFLALKQAISNKDPVEAFAAAIMGFGGLKQAEQGLPACEAVDTKSWDFKGLVNATEKISNPLNLIHHKMDILKQSEQLISSKSFTEAGEAFGAILKLATQPEKPVHLEWSQKRIEMPKVIVDRKDVTSFAQAFLESTGVGHFNFTALLMCIQEGDQAALILNAVVGFIKEAIKNKDITGVVEGVVGTLAFVQTLEKAIPYCEAVDSSSLNWGVFD
jgi:hypothetical protein